MVASRRADDNGCPDFTSVPAQQLLTSPYCATTTFRAFILPMRGVREDRDEGAWLKGRPFAAASSVRVEQQCDESLQKHVLLGGGRRKARNLMI